MGLASETKAATRNGRAELMKFASDDPDQFESEIAVVAGPICIRPLEHSTFHNEVKLARLPRLGIFSVQCNAMRVFIPESPGFVSVTVPLVGHCVSPELDAGEIIASGTAHVGNLGRPYDLTMVDGSKVLVVNFDAELLRSYRVKLNGGEVSGDLTFPPRMSLTSAEGASFWRYMSFVWSELNRGSTLLQLPIIAREIEESLLAMFLYASDRIYSDEESRVSNFGCTYLRRAEEYILAHLPEPHSVADIAEISGVNVRTLSRAFKKRYGMGPMAFCKERRLEHAQRMLLAADPESATVTQIATQIGFYHLGQFSKDYRHAFHELPSETLRR